MIYSVIPEELAGELYDRLAEYYKDDPNVTVIVDRRKRDRRVPAAAADGAPASSDGAHDRALRDRRRSRVAGEFPPVDTT